MAAWVQGVYGALGPGGGATSAAVTITGVTAGNALVGAVFGSGATSPATITVTDNHSQTYTVQTNDIGVVSGSVGMAIFTFFNTVSGSLTITANSTQTIDFMQVEVEEYSGLSGADGATVQRQSSPGSGTDAVTSGNITTTVNGDVIWSLSINGSGATTGTSSVAAGTSFTQRFQDPAASGTDWGGTSEDRVQISAGSIAGTWTANTGLVVYQTGVIALKVAVATSPLVDTTSQFPIRSKIDYRMLAAVSKQDEQWPFTATPNPLKMQGIYYDPQFPVRRRFRPLRQFAEEQWPFTAVPTPTQFGWDNPEKFSQRIRYRPKSTLADEEWPFTAATLGIFGWDNPEKFPSRIRYRTSSTVADEQWPFTAVPTPAQFGWDNPEKFSQRIRFRPSRSADEQWPFTAVPTPTQLGFLFPDPPPIRSRPRQLALSSKQDEQWPFLVIAAPIVVPYDTQFPIRARFRTFQSNDEEWLFTAVLTPTQTGFLTQDPTPVIRRPQQLALMSKEDEQWLLSVVGPTTLEGAWYVDQTFPPVTAENPGAWFSPHAWFIKVI